MGPAFYHIRWPGKDCGFLRTTRIEFFCLSRVCGACCGNIPENVVVILVSGRRPWLSLTSFLLLDTAQDLLMRTMMMLVLSRLGTH